MAVRRSITELYPSRFPPLFFFFFKRRLKLGSCRLLGNRVRGPTGPLGVEGRRGGPKRGTALGPERAAFCARRPAPWAAFLGAPCCGRCCAGHAFQACWCAPVPVSPAPVGSWADGFRAAFVCARATAQGLVLSRRIVPAQPPTGVRAFSRRKPFLSGGETSTLVALKGLCVWVGGDHVLSTEPLFPRY